MDDDDAGAAFFLAIKVEAAPPVAAANRLSKSVLLLFSKEVVDASVEDGVTRASSRAEAGLEIISSNDSVLEAVVSESSSSSFRGAAALVVLGVVW